MSEVSAENPRQSEEQNEKDNGTIMEEEVVVQENEKKDETTAPTNDNPDEMTLEDLIKTEKKSLKDRIIKQKQKVKVIEGKNFNTRQDINFEDEALVLRSEVLHVYGVDFLSTHDIMSYFSRFEPTKIEWLNDSSCNVVFPSEEKAEAAVQALSLTIQNDPNLSEEWKKGIPYKERNIEFSLYFRIATTKENKTRRQSQLVKFQLVPVLIKLKDVKGENISGKESQYYKYMRQKTQTQRLQRQSRYEERNNQRGNNRNYNDRGRSNRSNDRYNSNRSSRIETKEWRKNKFEKNNKKNKRDRSSSQNDDKSGSEQRDQSRSRSRSEKSQLSNRSSGSQVKEKRSNSKEQERQKSRSSEKVQQASNSQKQDDDLNDNDDL